MRNQKRLVAGAASVALTVLFLPGSAAGASTTAEPSAVTTTAVTTTAVTTTAVTTTLRFHVLFSPFNYTDLGKPGPSAADVIVFHDQLRENGTWAGDEVGSCVLVDPTGLSNCTGVMQLKGRGTITFSFVNSPPPHKVLAVTGGSGQFRAVRGDATLDENEDQTGTLVLRLTR